MSLFAQELKTPFPVSFKRVEKAWADLVADDGLQPRVCAVAYQSAPCYSQFAGIIAAKIVEADW